MERCSTSFFRFCVHISVMKFYNAFYERESDTGAVKSVMGIISTIKRIEYIFQFTFRYADTGVAYFQKHIISLI